MHRTRILLPTAVATAVTLASVATPVRAEVRSFADLLEVMNREQTSAAEGVASYALDVTTMGHDATLYFERADVTTRDGKTIPAFRPVSPDEAGRRAQEASGMTPEAWQAYAEGLRTTGDAVGNEIERGMAESGLPPGLARTLGAGAAAEPWASPDPRVMMGAMATFVEAAATGRSDDGDGRDAANDADVMAAFVRHAELVGQETIDGRKAHLARADGLDLRQEADGRDFTVRSISMWVDVERALPLRMRMAGTVRDSGRDREIFVERTDGDHRVVPGYALVVPYRSVVRMGGVLDKKERAEMEEAQRQLADFDRQLASMPSAQRAMVERQVGPQIETLRKLVEGGTFEVETTVRAVRVN